MNSINDFLITLFLLVLGLSSAVFYNSCEAEAAGPAPFERVAHSPSGTFYRLDHPDRSYTLPNILVEVSGLTDLDNQTVACVQDEDGIVFIYDLERGEVTRRINFAGPGDYEGITRVGRTLYVLRSDGHLFKLDDYTKDQPEVLSYATEVPVDNNEGLGYDAQTGLLLIAGKSEPSGGAFKNKRTVFTFDPKTKETARRATFVYDETQLKRANVIEYGGARDEEDVKVRINPSAIAIHPISDEVYVLSSKDRLLYVFDRDNEVRAVHLLPKRRYAQPEGITFMPNGDMLISNEGKKNRATLLRFNYRAA